MSPTTGASSNLRDLTLEASAQKRYRLSEENSGVPWGGGDRDKRGLQEAIGRRGDYPKTTGGLWWHDLGNKGGYRQGMTTGVQGLWAGGG